jgi:uncharacterized membrane protein YfcA
VEEVFTVPVLVYLFGIDAFLATEYSLLVGISSLVGSVSYFKKDWLILKWRGIRNSFW